MYASVCQLWEYACTPVTSAPHCQLTRPQIGSCISYKVLLHTMMVLLQAAQNNCANCPCLSHLQSSRVCWTSTTPTAPAMAPLRCPGPRLWLPPPKTGRMDVCLSTPMAPWGRTWRKVGAFCHAGGLARELWLVVTSGYPAPLLPMDKLTLLDLQAYLAKLPTPVLRPALTRRHHH